MLEGKKANISQSNSHIHVHHEPEEASQSLFDALMCFQSRSLQNEMKKLIKFKGELQQMWKAGGTSFDHRAKLNIWLRVQLTGNMALCADQSAPNKTLKPTFFFYLQPAQ